MVREDKKSLLQQRIFCEVIFILDTFGIMSSIPSGPQPTGDSPYNFFHQPCCLAEEEKKATTSNFHPTKLCSYKFATESFNFFKFEKLWDPHKAW
jgi:hypothetical protein